MNRNEQNACDPQTPHDVFYSRYAYGTLVGPPRDAQFARSIREDVAAERAVERAEAVARRLRAERSKARGGAR